MTFAHGNLVARVTPVNGGGRHARPPPPGVFFFFVQVDEGQDARGGGRHGLRVPAGAVVDAARLSVGRRVRAHQGADRDTPRPKTTVGEVSRGAGRGRPERQRGPPRRCRGRFRSAASTTEESSSNVVAGRGSEKGGNPAPTSPEPPRRVRQTSSAATSRSRAWTVQVCGGARGHAGRCDEGGTHDRSGSDDPLDRDDSPDRVGSTLRWMPGRLRPGPRDRPPPEASGSTVSSGAAPGRWACPHPVGGTRP